MSQIQNTIITKNDIVDYVDKMKIKKSNIGGLDKVDVYIHIQELIKMYGNYAEQELDKQKETLDKQQKEIEELTVREKAAREELDSRQAADDAKEQEINRQKDQLDSLIYYKELAVSLQSENEAQREKIEQLKGSEELIERLNIENKTIQEEKEILNQEIELCKKEIEELKKAKTILSELQEELDKYKAYAQELEKQTQIQRTEIDELNQYKDQAVKLQNEVLRQKSETEELDGYKEAISKLQREKQEQDQQIEKLMKYETLAVKLQTEISVLKMELEGLQQPEVFTEETQEELKSRTEEMQENLKRCTKEILELKEELQRQTLETHEFKSKLWESQALLAKKEKFYMEMIQNLENVKEEGKEQEDEPVSISEDIQKKLSEQEQIIMEKEQKIHSVMRDLREKEKELANLQKEEDAGQGLKSYSYMEEIGEILRESRREGQSIINNACIEAEKEMIKLLNLRAKYKQENERYRNWCKRVEMEKKSVEEFLKQLSDQYENANKALVSVKEGADSFDIKRIFRAIEIEQINAEEVDYEEMGLV